MLTGYLPSAELLDAVKILGGWQPRIAGSEGLKGYDEGYVSWVDLYSNVATCVLLLLHIFVFSLLFSVSLAYDGIN